MIALWGCDSGSSRPPDISDGADACSNESDCASDAGPLGSRRAPTGRGGCDGGEPPVARELAQALALQASDTWNLASHIEICDATFVGVGGENAVFDLDGTEEDVRAVLHLGSRVPEGSAAMEDMWAFAFVDDTDVTASVFGDANLLTLEPDGSAHSFAMNLPESLAADGGMLTLLLIDRLFATDPGEGRNSGHVRVFVNGAVDAPFPPEVERVPSADAVADPFPQPILFETGREDRDAAAATLTFARGQPSRGAPTTEVSVFPFDPATGRRTELQCEGDGEGWIVSSTSPGSSARIECLFGERHAGTETAAVVLHDQFVVDPETGEPYLSLFLSRKLLTLDVRDFL